MDISIIIPLLNEAESLPELTSWIDKVMQSDNFSYEIIFVDDGSTDASWEVINNLAHTNKSIRAIKFRRNYGKSPALNIGFEEAKGDVVITMDADLQDSPDEIPELYDMIANQKFDLVSGWKKQRYDPISKTIPSKFFNWTARMVTGIKLHDFNCGLKAYRKALVKNIEVYGEMHRYIPVIAKEAGFKKITEKIVEHRARKYGETKFGLNRFINGFLDLLSITFITRFGKKPMHFFGLLGTLIFFIGFVILIYLTYEKFILHIYKMTERPLFYFGLVTIVLGTQLFLTGFIAEMIARTGKDKNRYIVEEKI